MQLHPVLVRLPYAHGLVRFSGNSMQYYRRRYLASARNRLIECAPVVCSCMNSCMDFYVGGVQQECDCIRLYCAYTLPVHHGWSWGIFCHCAPLVDWMLVVELCVNVCMQRYGRPARVYLVLCECL